MTAELLDFNKARKQGELPRNTIDADDIRARMHANPRAFIDWLYSGRAFIPRTGHEARVGDVTGTPGASLSISLTGKDAGLWNDHATDEGGDLIGLYRACMGYHDKSNFVLSLKEIARDFLGDPVEIERPHWQPTVLERIEKKKQELGTKPRADLLELGAPVAKFRYYDVRGNVIAAVVRYEPDGTRENKTFRPYCFRTVDGRTKWVAGSPDIRPLYRLPEIALESIIVLCEGEGCADALVSIGIPATTAMQGASAPIEKTDWSPLQSKTVIIWPDNDDPGRKYATAVAAKLVHLGCALRMVAPPADAKEKWDAADCVAEGGDAATLIRSAVALQGAPTEPRPRIRLLDIDEIEDLQPPRWLIDGILTENGLSILWGRSGALKSFVALDIALCIATGLAWHGKAVQHGLVIYVAAEGSHGLGRRAVGWRRTRGKELSKPRFKLIPHAIALTSDDLDALVERIMQLEAKPVLIIMDTLARTFGAGDENKQADMNAYVTAADKLREATGASIMIIHHSGVHEDRRERGSNVLRGAADTVIKVSRKDSKIDIINQAPEGKQKDAEEFETIKLRTQKVYFEQAKVEQSTLILNSREEDATDEPDGEADASLTKNEMMIVAALKSAGTPLGFTRLKLQTGLNDGSISRSLRSLEDKEIILQNSENPKAWTLL